MSYDPHKPESPYMMGCLDVLTISFYLAVAAGIIGGLLYLVGR